MTQRADVTSEFIFGPDFDLGTVEVHEDLRVVMDRIGASVEEIINLCGPAPVPFPISDDRWAAFYRGERPLEFMLPMIHGEFKTDVILMRVRRDASGQTRTHMALMPEGVFCCVLDEEEANDA